LGKYRLYAKARKARGSESKGQGDADVILHTFAKPNPMRSKQQVREVIFSKAKDTKERNSIILKAYQEGYSLHMIAKVLELN